MVLLTAAFLKDRLHDLLANKVAPFQAEGCVAGSPWHRLTSLCLESLTAVSVLQGLPLKPNATLEPLPPRQNRASL